MRNATSTRYYAWQTPPEAVPYGQFVLEIIDLSNAYCDVRAQLQSSQVKQKDYYDKGIKESQYNPGDLVYLYNPQLKTGEAAKFHLYWKGPYEIVRRVTEVTYEIKKSGHRKVVHFNNLKLYQRYRKEDGKKGENVVETTSGQESACRELETNEPKEEQGIVVPLDEIESDEEKDNPVNVTLPERPSDNPVFEDSSETLSPPNECLNEPGDEQSDLEDNSRPRRTRKPPARFGFTAITSTQSVALALKERVQELETARYQQYERIKRLKPQWLKKAAKLKRNLKM